MTAVLDLTLTSASSTETTDLKEEKKQINRIILNKSFIEMFTYMYDIWGPR